MTTEIPIGFGLGVFSFAVDGSPHTCQTTFGFLTDPLQTIEATRGALYNAWTQVGKPFNADNIGSGWSLIGFKVTQRLQNGDLQVSEDFTVVDGNGSDQPIPMNGALLVEKRTGLAGRRMRGRMFVPPFGFAEGEVSGAGIIETVTLASQQNKYNAALTAMTTFGFPMTLFHSDAGFPSPVLSLLVKAKVGTLRRRLRS